METPHELKKQVRDLIAANKTEKALELLAKKQLSALDRDLIILNGRFNKIKDDQRMGILDNDVAARELNMINIGLLDLSEKIGITVEKTPPRVLSTESQEKPNKKILLIAAGVLLVAIIGFFGIRMLSNSPSNDPDPGPPAPTSLPAAVQADFKMDKTNCPAPCEVQFTNSSKNADEFLWDFGDGQISNLPDPLHKYIEEKTYEVTLTASSESGRAKETKTIQINAPPPPPPGVDPLPIANFKMDKSTCNAPCKISFTNLSKNAKNYSWMVGGKKESGKKDFQRSFNTSGKYSIKLIASNGSKDNTYEQFIQIDAPSPTPVPLPVANFTMNKSTCIAPCEITFTNTSKEATNFSWKVNDKQESGSRDFKRTFKSPGKYSIKLIASNGSKDNTYEQFIRIDAPPPPPPPPNTFVHGGQTYKFKKMNDGKNWMTQNLNYEMPGSWCHSDDKRNCEKYSRLYSWEAAKKACPSGWHLPSAKEWRTMLIAHGGYFDRMVNNGIGEAIGDYRESYRNLIIGGNSGFSALLGGMRLRANSFKDFGEQGQYWSKSEVDSRDAYYYLFWTSDGGHIQEGRGYKTFALSCRCIQN